jgi:putative transposase
MQTTITRAYRHRLRPTKEQESLLAQYAGCCRLLYNLALESREMAYAIGKRSPGRRAWVSYEDLTTQLTELKAEEGMEWLCTPPVLSLRQALKDLDRAYEAFFERGSGYPRYKRRGDGDSCRFVGSMARAGGSGAAGEGGSTADKGCAGHPGQVWLSKLGWIKAQNAYPGLKGQGLLHEGDLLGITVSKEPDGWHASLTCRVAWEVPDHREERVRARERAAMWAMGDKAGRTEGEASPLLAHTLLETPSQAFINPGGLDLGIACSVALSTGELLHLPLPTPGEEAHLAHLQRLIDKAQKGSKNREKLKLKRRRCVQHLIRRRRHAMHEITLRLVKEHDLIAIEDLRVSAMTASASGTVEEPGANVAQKTGLNRAILAQAWGEFRGALEYKGAWHGCEVIRVPAHHTSQECSVCGHTSPENRKSQAGFQCVACGHEGHADVDAARVILGRGLRAWGEEQEGQQAECLSDGSTCLGPDEGHVPLSKRVRLAPS